MAALGSKAQRRVSIVSNGPDPAGEANWDALAQRTALELSPFGAPASVRVGMKGNAEDTFYGDPTPPGSGRPPLQAFPAAYGAPGSFRSEMAAEQALPATAPPAATPATLKSYVASFGL